MRARLVMIACALVWTACGEEAPEAPAHETLEPPSPAEPEAPAPEATPAATAEPAAPTARPVNLLVSVPSAIAVSSVYRDQTDQIARLVDGGLETAWNTRSGDLVGAWIDVRLPAEVTVTSIELTAGFTRDGGSTDLFTGNHRIARVRVLHDGAALGEFDLDTSSRALQPIAVTGGGGVYRIEVVRVLPGSRTEWREVCVSELRVMGTAPHVVEGDASPRFGVGTLPELGSATDGLPPELSDRDDQITDEILAFASAWGTFDRAQIHAEFNTGEPGVSPEQATGFRDQRREIFGRIATLLEPVDAPRAAELRRAAEESGAGWSWATRRGDLDVAAAALQAAVDASGQPFVRCTWASSHAAIRLERMISLAEWERERTEWSVDEISALEDEDSAETRRAERAAEAASRAADAADALAEAWSTNPAGAARRFASMQPPAIPLTGPDWDVCRAQVAVAAEHCAWSR